MNTKTVVRAITLTIAAALTVMAINLQAYVVPPVLSAEVTVAQHTGGGEEAYPIELPLNSLLCPC
jgi:hypothetical protein